ncbi:MAG: sulfite exporter TauE/SafE family protein [Kofleriaceae bacterium]
MIAGWGAVLAASLLGSLHCAVMCGPLLALHRSGSSAQRWRGVLLHQLGRALGYAGLGALAGAVGAIVDLAGAALAVQRAAMIGAALALGAWGVALALRARRGAATAARAGAASRLWGRGLVQLRRRPPARRALGLGLLNTLLPCGWLWAFATLAAGTGAPAAGALTMLVFWLGTVPALLGVHALAAPLLARLRPRWPMVTAGLVLSLAGAALLLRLPLLGAPPAGSVEGSSGPACHDEAAVPALVDVGPETGPAPKERAP